jgi:hypothetical protein
MAEINVQRKKPAGWLWLLGIAAVVLFVLALGGLWDRDDVDTVAAPVAAVPPPEVAPTTGIREPAPAEVAAFLVFTDASVGSPAGPAHEYAADGIRRLAAALNAVIEQQHLAGIAVRDQLAAFRAKADRIQADPQAMQHAEGVREVFTSAADLMSAAQKERWAQETDLRDRVSEVHSAATAVDGRRPLLEQTAAVDAFFDRAAVVVRSMSSAD